MVGIRENGGQPSRHGKTAAGFLPSAIIWTRARLTRKRIDLLGRKCFRNFQGSGSTTVRMRNLRAKRLKYGLGLLCEPLGDCHPFFYNQGQPLQHFRTKENLVDISHV